MFYDIFLWLCVVNPEWKSEPFDFLINGELVRMSLEQFLLAKGISAVLYFYCFFCLSS